MLQISFIQPASPMKLHWILKLLMTLDFKDQHPTLKKNQAH